MTKSSQPSLALRKANEKRQEMRMAGIVPERLSPAEKASANPTSLTSAVRAKCWTCQGGAGPAVKVAVGDCRTVTCPLWPNRPWQDKYEGPAISAARRVGMVQAEDRNYCLQDNSWPIRQDAARNPASRRMAVDAMCFECVGGYCDSGAKERVRDCGVTKCPLWHQRPWQNIL